MQDCNLPPARDVCGHLLDHGLTSSKLFQVREVQLGHVYGRFNGRMQTAFIPGSLMDDEVRAGTQQGFNWSPDPHRSGPGSGSGPAASPQGVQAGAAAAAGMAGGSSSSSGGGGSSGGVPRLPVQFKKALPSSGDYCFKSPVWTAARFRPAVLRQPYRQVGGVGGGRGLLLLMPVGISSAVFVIHTASLLLLVLLVTGRPRAYKPCPAHPCSRFRLHMPWHHDATCSQLFQHTACPPPCLPAHPPACPIARPPSRLPPCLPACPPLWCHHPQSNPQLLEALNELRIGRLSASTQLLLSECQRPLPDDGITATHLFPHKQDVRDGRCNVVVAVSTALKWREIDSCAAQWDA
jgi:hypothetical protein